MQWKSMLMQALVAIVVVVLVLAFLNVLRARTKLDPVASLSRPFYPAIDETGGGADAGMMA